MNQYIPNIQHQHASTSTIITSIVNVNPADMNVAYTAAFATPFQFGMQGIQYGIKDREYGQDGQLHNVKIQGIRKRKCRECDNYGCKGANNRNNCENKKA